MSSSKKSSRKLKKIVVSPPPVASEVPDKHTKTNPSFTDGGAPNQVFHVKLGILSYGTDDKTHAAAMCLSLIMLLIVIICLILGAIVGENEWINRILDFIGPAFLITVGVAIGQSVSDQQNLND